jgi:hypothetical protein
MRNGPQFAVVAAIALGDLLPEVRWARWLTARGSEVFRIRPADSVQAGRAGRGPWVVLPVALLLVLLGVQAAGLRVPLIGRGWASLHADSNPVELLPNLRVNEQSRSVGTPIFNEMVFAGFLIYSTPRLRVFIDDRCELYGDAFLLEYQDALLRDPARIDRWSQEYGFDSAVTANGSGFDRYLATASAWSPVKRTPKASFYRRFAHQSPGPL